MSKKKDDKKSRQETRNEAGGIPDKGLGTLRFILHIEA